MPRTRDDLALQRTIPKRPTPMKTRVIDGVELATDIRDRNGLPPHIHLPNRSRRDLRHPNRSNKRHLSSLPELSLSTPAAHTVLVYTPGIRTVQLE